LKRYENLVAANSDAAKSAIAGKDGKSDIGHACSLMLWRLAPLTAADATSGPTIETATASAKSKPAWQIGRTRVFLTPTVHTLLEQKLIADSHRRALLIQTQWRARRARRNWKIVLTAHRDLRASISVATPDPAHVDRMIANAQKAALPGHIIAHAQSISAQLKKKQKIETCERELQSAVTRTSIHTMTERLKVLAVAIEMTVDSTYASEVASFESVSNSYRALSALDKQLKACRVSTDANQLTPAVVTQMQACVAEADSIKY
jgi:hypothetical protein